MILAHLFSCIALSGFETFGACSSTDDKSGCGYKKVHWQWQTAAADE